MPPTGSSSCLSHSEFPNDKGNQATCTISPAPWLCLELAFVTPQSWVMAGISLHLRAEEREFGEGKGIWPYWPATQTPTGPV